MDNSGKWQKFITLFFLAFSKNVQAQIKFLHQKKKSELQHITRDI